MTANSAVCVQTASISAAQWPVTAIQAVIGAACILPSDAGSSCSWAGQQAEQFEAICGFQGAPESCACCCRLLAVQRCNAHSACSQSSLS